MPYPRHLRRAPLLLALAGALAGAALGACSDGETPDAPVIATLPPGELSSLVVQPTEVASGVVPILAQTGPADATRIASFSADPTAAAASLASHGFERAYVVQYGDPATRRSVTSVVARFGTEAGATADLTGDLTAARATGTPYDEPGLGDQAGGVESDLNASAGTGSLVTLRWRLGRTTWLIAIGATGKVDRAVLRTLAERILARAAGSATPSPTP